MESTEKQIDMIPFPPKQAYNLSKECKTQLRARLFMQLEGFPVVASMAILGQKGLLNELKDPSGISLSQIQTKYGGNEGYLNVAMRILCSQGYATQQVDPLGADRHFWATDLGNQVFHSNERNLDLLDWMKLASSLKEIVNQPMSNRSIVLTNKVIGHLCNSKMELLESSERSISELSHVEGVICGPLLVFLSMNGCFENLSDENPKIEIDNFPIHTDWQLWINEVFTQLKWINQQESSVFASPEGLFYFRRANAYGVTVSYLQTFSWMEELLFGKANKLWDNPKSAHEIHVDRTMNVWGSGGAHSTYFNKIDEIILEMFNQPLDLQPKGIVDMGCGNGALLIHLYQIILEKTLRGKHLEDFPLAIIGADLNEAALVSTKENFENSNVDGVVIKGDIGNPEELANNLQSRFNLDLGQMLNVRSFLDHNRLFSKPEKIDVGRTGKSSGAFAFRGRRIPNFELEQELSDHFKKWLPYVKQFGLLLIELHTIKPELAAAHIGKTAITAYDGTHGFTDQYIVEYDLFKQILKEVGLEIAPGSAFAFPSFDMTTVSIQLLKG
jgi:SAM-dependent methyltransferase